VAGFPNFFMLYGPNTNLGHNSIVYMLESQIEHIARCMRELGGLRGGPGATMEVPAPRQNAFNAALQQRMRRTVWASGCTSWYQTAEGHSPINWPGFTLSYRWMTRRAGLKDYAVR